MSSSQTPVHVAPLLMLRDAVSLLILVVGLNDHFRPAEAWVAPAFRFPEYTWLLLGIGGALTLWTLVSWGLQFRGYGLIASHDFSE